MSLNRNGAPPGYHDEAGRIAYLGDLAGAYTPVGASAPTTDPARAYGGKRATAPTLAAAGTYIPGTGATSSAADIVDPAGTYSSAGAGAPTTDPAVSYSVPGASAPTLAIAGTYIPVAGSNSAAGRVVDPARPYSSTGAATIDPAGAYSVPGAGAPAPAGANIPVSEANSAVAEIVDPAGAYSLAGASPATTDPARAYIGAGAWAPVLSTATEIVDPAGAPGPASAGMPADAGTVSDLSASPDALNPNGAPAGYYYQAGATAYIEDPAGTYSLAGATTPTADPGGKYSGPGASAATQDPAGTYSSPYALDRLFLETTSATPDNRVLPFNSETAVANYYGATSDEAGLATEFFTTYGSSANMLFVRFPLGGNRAHLYGGNVTNLALVQEVNGPLSVTSQGYKYSGQINLSGVTSLTLAATAIQAALNQNLPVVAVTTGSSITAAPTVSFMGSVNGLLLDVTSITSGSIEIGALIAGAKVPAGTQINSQFTGTPGGVGLYSLYVPGGIIPSEAMTESYGILSVGSTSSGTVKGGEQVTGAGVLPDTAIEENLGGNTWLVNFAQAVASEDMTMTGAPLSVLYNAVIGVTEDSGYFSIQQNGDFNYASASLTYATSLTGSAATTLGLTQAAGAWLAAQGGNITSEAAFMNALVETEDGQFGSVQSTWSQLAEEDPESQIALEEWAQSWFGQYQFLENDTTTAPPAGTSTPTMDPAGTYSGAGASLPTPAAPGTYIPNAGATSSAAQIYDPVGTFSGPGASAPTPAQPGYYVGITGASTETPAAAGTYISVTRATSATAEVMDPAGTYSPAGASGPTTDPAGTYSGADVSAPTLAAAGTYIPGAGATSKAAEIQDPAGSYSLAGASAPTLAQPGYYVPNAGASSETLDSSGYYTPYAGATAEFKAQAPTISGTKAGQTTAPLETDTPFSLVTIIDPNTDTTDTLTIKLTGDGGTLTDGAGFDGLTTSAPGVYILSGTAAAITSELDALIFTPNASYATRTFTLTDTTSAGTTLSDANTTVNVEPTTPPVVSVPTFLADQSSLDQDPGGFDILGLTSQITANLDQLNNDPHINSITILDNGQVGLSVQQLTSDATAIGELQNADSSLVLLAVHDTTANIEAGLSTLVADTDKIASITASDAPVVSVSTFSADQKTLDKIVGGFAISDTAANVAQDLDALNADTNVTSIALTDGGAPTLALSLEEALNDTGALNAITGPHTIAVADNASATITSTQAIYLSGENIAVDGAPVIATGTVATMAILAQIVTSLLESQGYTLAVVDTAANIRALTTAQINNLSARGVLLLESSDTSVALSAKLAQSLEAAHMTVMAPTGLSVMLKADKAGIDSLSTTTIAGLPALGVTSIVSTNGPVDISVAQALALEGANLRIRGANGDRLTVTVSDLASNIASLTPSEIAALPATGVSHIAISNSANLALSVAQALALETDSVKVKAQTGFSVTISDSATNLEGLTASQIDGLTAIGVTGLVSTNADVSYTSAQTAAILKSDISVSALGSFTVTESATNLQNETFVYGPGFGHDTLIGFLEAGAGHDLLQFSDSMFGFSSSSSQTADAQALLNNFASGTTNTTITDLQGDTLTIDNHAISTFQNPKNLQDFKFTT